MPELLPLESGYYIWKYVPSIPASAISAVLWLLASCFLGWRMIRSRVWFCSPLIFGCFSKILPSITLYLTLTFVTVEFIGYCARASAANHTNKLMPYIIQSTFILLPPTLFAATIYICLGRIIILVGGEHLSIVRPRWLTRVFIGGDVFSFCIQGGAAGLLVMANTNPSMGQLGKWLIILGLATQLISFALFGLTAVLFYTRLRRTPTTQSYKVDPAWIQTMYMLYGVSGFIILRSIFRIVEYVMGDDGYPLTHEWTLYIFDTLPMLAVAGLFYLRYPSNITLRKAENIELESQNLAE